MALRAVPMSNLGLRATARPAGFALKAVRPSALRLIAYAYVPDHYKYAETDEWASVEGDVATVGLTEYAQNKLGIMVFVDLPEVGTVVSAGDAVGSVESVSDVRETFAPVSGEVIEVNTGLQEDAELLNEAYTEGWIMKIKMSNMADLDKLMDAAAYKAKIATP